MMILTNYLILRCKMPSDMKTICLAVISNVLLFLSNQSHVHNQSEHEQILRIHDLNALSYIAAFTEQCNKT